MVRLRAKGLRLSFPLPVYVLGDLLQSMEDLCEVILPRFGLPNYAAALRNFLAALTDLPDGLPLADIQTDKATILCTRIR